jgi:hypothetical protein
MLDYSWGGWLIQLSPPQFRAQSSIPRLTKPWFPIELHSITRAVTQVI